MNRILSVVKLLCPLYAFGGSLFSDAIVFDDIKFLCLCPVVSRVMCICNDTVVFTYETQALLQIVAINTQKNVQKGEVENVIKKGVSDRNQPLGSVRNTKCNSRDEPVIL